jgi:CHAT domain-containing protein
LLLEATPPPERIAGLYGNPSFRLDEQQISIHSSASPMVSRALTSESFDDFRNQSFAELPGSMDEINKLAQLFAGKNVKVNYHSGQDASETNLRGEKASILHIATHGFFLNQQPGFEINAMIRSGIILAGVNNAQSNAGDDGIVTAYEATTLNLQGTELVVLSACETGLGESRNGVGVYGLQRGLTVAGAQHLLMSLWKVDDTATDLLMQKFYTAWLSGMEIHEAFKLAQLELAKTYPHPFYWGAFILIGK